MLHAASCLEAVVQLQQQLRKEDAAAPGGGRAAGVLIVRSKASQLEGQAGLRLVRGRIQVRNKAALRGRTRSTTGAGPLALKYAFVCQILA